MITLCNCTFQAEPMLIIFFSYLLTHSFGDDTNNFPTPIFHSFKVQTLHNSNSYFEISIFLENVADPKMGENVADPKKGNGAVIAVGNSHSVKIYSDLVLKFY